MRNTVYHIILAEKSRESVFSAIDVFLSNPIVAYATPNGIEVVNQPGDINKDGNVNILDLSILLANFGKKAEDAANPATDINGDGDINIQDLSILLANFGK